MVIFYFLLMSEISFVISNVIECNSKIFLKEAISSNLDCKIRNIVI